MPDYVKDLYQVGIKEVRAQLRSYWLNHAFMLGYQWVYWNQNDSRLDLVSTDADRIQATMNRTRANMRTLMSNLTQRELSFENPPTSYDDATVRAARIGLSLIEDIRQSHQWEVLREKHLFATVKGGAGAISVDWDSANKTTRETVLPIGEFLLEPGYSGNPAFARYWIRRQSLPTDQVWSMFKDYFKKDPPDADSLTSLDPYMSRVTGDSFGQGSGEGVKRTHVFTYYERPNPLCPDGKILVEVNDKIVEHIEKWPFPFKNRLNIAVATETPLEGKWYGATFLDDVRPVQVALNAAWSNILEHLRDAGAAKLTMPSSAASLVDALTDIPGEILEYPDGSDRPDYLTPAQLTGWLRDLPDLLAEVIDDLMGVHDVSRGMAPANIESGLGLSILAEKDSSPVGRLIKESARVWTEVAQMVLQLHEQEVTSPREVTILEGMSPLRTKWSGKEIAGQTRIFIPLDSVQPRSRAAMQAFARDMLQMGLITNVVQYAAVADLPGQEALISAVDPDVAKAKRENAAFLLGEIPLPAAFDDHAKHILTHNDFRKTDRYELLDDNARSIVDDHVQAHETVAAEEMGRAMNEYELNPALAAAPNATGAAPPLDLLAQGATPPPPPPAPPPPPPESGGEGEAVIDPEELLSQILNELGI